MPENINNQSDQPQNYDTGPSSVDIDPATQNLAINMIRDKLDKLYDQEPNAKDEEAEVVNTSHRSRHQQFMYELTTSGKSLATIQTEWHNYYINLSNADKHQVWHEFYASNKNARVIQPQMQPSPAAHEISEHINRRVISQSSAKKDKRTAAEIRRKIRESAITTPPAKLTLKHHIQSALFGLSMGALAVIVLLFGFFNQIIIAPFIQPSRNQTATPIILSNQSTIAASATPEVVIPKINVEIPVIYSITTTNENVIENNLEDGVIHYPTTAVPGQLGNAAYFGHSSNNIFNPGHYKFAFVLLHDLVPGDVFYLVYQGKVYAYKVFSRDIVSPNDVGVLNPVAGHSATATLITCDPPGTSLHRLVVVGDQISPAPSGDSTASQSSNAITASAITQLPGNGPTLWHRFISTTWSKFVIAVIVIYVIIAVWRWYNREFSLKP